LSQQPQFLYLITRGWKTAKHHKIEIWFVEYHKKYYIISERKKNAHWVQNILHNSNVTFTILNETLKGYARLVDFTESELITNVSNLMNQKYGWNNGLIVELYSV
jgi:hypothetical protein